MDHSKSTVLINCGLNYLIFFLLQLWSPFRLCRPSFELCEKNTVTKRKENSLATHVLCSYCLNVQQKKKLWFDKHCILCYSVIWSYVRNAIVLFEYSKQQDFSIPLWCLLLFYCYVRNQTMLFRWIETKKIILFLHRGVRFICFCKSLMIPERHELLFVVQRIKHNQNFLSFV